MVMMVIVKFNIYRLTNQPASLSTKIMIFVLNVKHYFYHYHYRYCTPSHSKESTKKFHSLYVILQFSFYISLLVFFFFLSLFDFVLLLILVGGESTKLSP